ncbi:MAG: EF2563 family selenium-dependent molybdenum hydroxylase system protein [Oscillospiraceae bacterium]|nr:EF2563 family selenium-dependent molybdenum hydroxylase system protein [Oscillospiraceae bacterium]
MLALIRGAGDLASGIALRLFRSGISVILTDLPHPTAIRRTVAFSEAIVHGKTEVEGVVAHRVATAAEALETLKKGIIPVLADAECRCRTELKPDVLVDAILAKRNLGTSISDAPIVVGVGPGFTAGIDCHAVVETMRGHTLGRVIHTGSALPNTNVPGLIGGFAGERVLRAPADGIFRAAAAIGDAVSEGDTVGFVAGVPMKCTISGVLRGLIADGTTVHTGMKSGDVDPRGEISYCKTASDKALAIGGGVLEAILHLSNALGGVRHGK